MNMRLVTLDFETYYDNEFTLKKIIPPLYITDPRFEVIGMSVAVGNAPPDFYRASEVSTKLTELDLGAEGTVVVAHNAAFDAGILSWKYGIEAWQYVCTIALARTVGLSLIANGSSLEKLGKALDLGSQKGHQVGEMAGVRAKDMSEDAWRLYGAYCNNDVAMTRTLYKRCMPLAHSIEREMISATIKMACHSLFTFDTECLRAYNTEVEESLKSSLLNIQRRIGAKSLEDAQNKVSKDTCFAEILRSYGVEPPTKFSVKKAEKVRDKNKGTDLFGRGVDEASTVYAFSSTDLEFTRLMGTHPNQVIRDLCETRLELKSSIARTRSKRLLDLAERGIATAPLEYASAHTGRYGGAMKINMQNLPRGALRRSLACRPDEYVVAVDSSQIEARVNAYVANQADMLAIFENGEDLYSHMGAVLAGTTYKAVYEANKAGTELAKYRKLGKVTELACGYQMGVAKFEDTLAKDNFVLPDGLTAKDVVYTYRKAKDKIVSAWAFNADVVLPTLAQGGQLKFGGPKGDLFFANGADTLFGQRCPTITLPNGYKLKYLGLSSKLDDKGKYIEYTYLSRDDGKTIHKKIYGGLLQENLVQALAFAVIAYQGKLMLDRGIKLGLNVHDEWVFVSKIRDAEKNISIAEECMRTVPPWVVGCPINCAIDIGANYQDVVEL